MSYFEEFSLNQWFIRVLVGVSNTAKLPKQKQDGERVCFFSLNITCKCHNWVQLCLIFIFCQIYKSLGCQKICQNTPASPSCFDKFTGILETCISDKTFTGIIEPNINYVIAAVESISLYDYTLITTYWQCIISPVIP